MNIIEYIKDLIDSGIPKEEATKLAREENHKRNKKITSNIYLENDIKDSFRERIQYYNR